MPHARQAQARIAPLAVRLTIQAAPAGRSRATHEEHHLRRRSAPCLSHRALSRRRQDHGGGQGPAHEAAVPHREAGAGQYGAGAEPHRPRERYAREGSHDTEAAAPGGTTNPRGGGGFTNLFVKNPSGMRGTTTGGRRRSGGGRGRFVRGTYDPRSSLGEQVSLRKHLLPTAKALVIRPSVQITTGYL